MPRQQQLTGNAALSALLTSPDCYASTLLVWAVDTFMPPEGEVHPLFQWSPETVHHEVEAELRRQMPPHVFDRLMAAIALRSSDAFYQQVDRFIPLVNALCGSGFHPEVYDPADLSECCWAITEAYLLDPPEPGEGFCEEIRAYLGAQLRQDGYATPPDVLKIAIGADVLEQLRYAYADDPEMFDMIYSSQQSRTQEVEQMVAHNLVEMVGQLSRLPLRYGSTKVLERAALQMAKRLQRKVDNELENEQAEATLM